MALVNTNIINILHGIQVGIHRAKIDVFFSGYLYCGLYLLNYMDFIHHAYLSHYLPSKILEKTLLSYWDPNKTNNGLPVLGPWQLIQYLTAQLIKFSTGCHLQKIRPKWKMKIDKTLISRSLPCWVVQCNLGSNLRRYFGTISTLHYSHEIFEISWIFQIRDIG